ncbi:M48 family metalloprotease [Variovorax sp. RO1]|uniref:M48 family metalloprotease n=1 Tax=Variovorax sp. RO1 TaxID=2066034 RepID=UPI000C717E3D|nr:M48 family metallopeptidase [Variovorax sp. RO1]
MTVAAQARPHPFSQRATLATLAVLAELTFVGASMLGWAPLIILQGVFLGPVVATATGVAFTLMTWWIVQPTVWITGTVLPRDKAPTFFRALDDLRQQLDAPSIDHVVLIDEPNAAAYQSGGFLALAGGRRTLMLGVPLLKLLSDRELLAVVAHELGHFSRRHGRLGHWIYNVRAKWDIYLDSNPARDGGIDRLRRWIASAFLPRFIRMSASWSRACEFEADALAAQATSGADLARALTKLEITGSLMRSDLRTRLGELQAASIDAPRTFWNVVGEFVRDTGTTQLEAALADARRRPPRRNDSHPALDDRAQALGQSVAIPHWTEPVCAGELLFGANWATELAAANTRWHEKTAPTWRLQHLKLAALQAEQWPAGAPGGDGHALERLLADDAINATDESLSNLERHAQAHASDALAQYGLGRALLQRARNEGIEQMRNAIRLDKRLAVAGYGEILGHLHAHGTEAEIREFTKRLDLAAEKLDKIREKLWRHLLKEPLSPLPLWAAQLLSKAIDEDDAIDGCWAVRADIANEAELVFTVNILVVRVRHAKLTAEEANEDALIERYASYLGTLFPHNELARVRVFFDTEVMSPRLLERFAQVRGCEIRTPTVPINVGLIKIDSL